jgi:multimeric flavodoxin WrbA
VIIIGSPSSGHSVTGYMKNWLDRFCNSQLIFDVDKNNKVHKKSRLSSGIKAIIVVTGCTGNLTSTVEPIEAVLSSMSIPILNRLIIPNIRLDEHYSISNDTHLMQQAYEIGIHL